MNGPAPDTPPPDLLNAVAAGRPEAIDTWFRAEHPVVYRLCFGFLADPHEADDAAQDAMLHLIDRLDAYDPARPYPAWRNTVVLNQCRDRRRRNVTRSGHESVPARRAPPARPEQEASARELQDLLRRALVTLSPREREAFVLRDLHGQSTAEVAEVLGVTAGSVRSLVTLARRRLARALGPELVPASGAPS